MPSKDLLDDHAPVPSHSMVEHEAHIVHYPDHPERKASAEYNRTHHELCVVQDTPCFVCGFKHSQSTPDRTTETHHVGAEWAAQQEVDWRAFKAKMQVLADIFARLAAIDPDKVAADPTDLVDSPDNMLVLCSVHHRDKTFGIHHAPFPEWLLQAFPKDDFEFLEAVVKESK